ncbi:MAG: class I SAM-dependent methyltransferase [Candidatus Adiutrix sp.]|nr:class I SAM-dependent methyltransferase [Candidatus Adiutrix sp.]
MIPDTELNIWEHSQNVRQLYRQRSLGEVGEMDASAQGAELLAPFITQAERPPRLLDAGCGSGYLWPSLKKRGLKVEYHGLDYSPSLIDIGRETLGLPPERLICGSIEDLRGQSFDLVALINTLSFGPDFRQPLARLADTGARAIVIRDNFGPETIRRWETDGYLDPGYNHLKAYWNQWQTAEVAGFLAGYGFTVTEVPDRRTRGRVEMVVDKPYYWSWLVAVRPGSLMKMRNPL